MLTSSLRRAARASATTASLQANQLANQHPCHICSKLEFVVCQSARHSTTVTPGMHTNRWTFKALRESRTAPVYSDSTGRAASSWEEDHLHSGKSLQPAVAACMPMEESCWVVVRVLTCS
jgi:hypothetical protein